MRTIVAALLSLLPAACIAQNASTSFLVFLRNDGRTWCGYTDTTAFRIASDSVRPTESARVTYSSGKLTQLTYQATSESGDWIVVDSYTPAKSGLRLRRANLLTQEDRKIIQEATISGTRTPHFRTVDVSTLNGLKATLSDVDYPDVPVRYPLTQFPFMRLVKLMRSQSASRLCRKLDDAGLSMAPADPNSAPNPA